MVYRRLGRLEDEVDLLERYCDARSSDDARSRFDARLSKARTLLARKRPTNDSGAHTSVRELLQRRRRPRIDGGTDIGSDIGPEVDEAVKPVAAEWPDADHEGLRELFALRSREVFDASLDNALALCSHRARLRGLPLEVLFECLRNAASTATNISESQRTARYNIALVQLLALSFDTG